MGDTKEEIEADDIALDDELFRSRADEERDRKLNEAISLEKEKLYAKMEVDALDAAKREAEFAERRAAEFKTMRGGDTVENLLKQLRDAGWRVASHSDYETNGNLMTRWIFIHRDGNGSYVGEASTDLGALRICAIKAESFAKGW